MFGRDIYRNSSDAGFLLGATAMATAAAAATATAATAAAARAATVA